MATKLLATLTFTNIAGYASSSQSHGLNDQGTALTPDFVYPSTLGAFTVAVTDTTVTVTNDADVTASITVAVERKHSIGRVDGGEALTPVVVQTGSSAGYGETVARYTYVNPVTGSDSTGTGTILLPYATINYALSKLGRILTSPHVIILTGTTLHQESVVIPPFESGMTSTFDVTGTPLPLTLIEYPLTIAADLEYGTQTPLDVVSWTPDSPTGLYQLVVTGVDVTADELIGRCVIGSGILEVAWIGRNTATIGGETTLNLTCISQFTAPIRLATPIELRAPNGSTAATVTARGTRGGFSLQGLVISHSGASTGRSLRFTDVLGEVWIGGCDIRAGYVFHNVSYPQFYQSQLSSTNGAAFGTNHNANRSMANTGLAAAFTYCLFKTASFLALNCSGADSYGWCYFRLCNDTGHGGGVYMGNTPFDYAGVWIDQCTNSGSASAVIYNGGGRSSLDACRIENCDTAVTVSEMGGGLRVKNVVGINTTLGIRVGDRRSPYLGGGGGSVRISSTTTVTGTAAGDTFIGEIGYRSYAAIRAAYGKNLVDPYTSSRIWEP